MKILMNTKTQRFSQRAMRQLIKTKILWGRHQGLTRIENARSLSKRKLKGFTTSGTTRIRQSKILKRRSFLPWNQPIISRINSQKSGMILAKEWLVRRIRIWIKMKKYRTKSTCITTGSGLNLSKRRSQERFTSDSSRTLRLTLETRWRRAL